MCQVEKTSSFKKDLKRLSKRELGVVDKVIWQIVNSCVSIKYKKHKMVDSQFTSVHICPDCVMLYIKDEKHDKVILHRIGNHNQIYGNKRWLKFYA